MKGFATIAVVGVLIASAAFAEQGDKSRATSQEWSVEPAVLYGRVATFLGLEPKVGESLVPEFNRNGVKPRDGVLLMVLAHHRMLQLLREERITKNDLEKTFRDGIGEFLEVRRTRPSWRDAITLSLGLDVHDLLKGANDTLVEATRPSRHTPRAVRPVTAATPREVPEDLVQPLLQRLSVGPEVLKQAWGALDPVAAGTPRNAVILLVLAKEKTDRLIEFGAVAQEDRQRVFYESLADFISQMEAEPTIGWGSLASQIGLKSVDLQQEARAIFNSAAKRRADRDQASGVLRDEPAVPVDLTRW